MYTSLYFKLHIIQYALAPHTLYTITIDSRYTKFTIIVNFNTNKHKILIKKFIFLSYKFLYFV